MKRTSRGGTPKPGQPPSDAATYRDLLLFEERLKTNAARLRRRKRKYQFLLLQLVFCIIILASDVLLSTDFLAWPANHLVQHIPIFTTQRDIVVPPYVRQSAFCIAVITLFLFYASGLYAEKIGYANRYVPHANKALRSFNMYLNVRAPPMQIPWPLNYILPSRSPDTSSPHVARGNAETVLRDHERRTTTIPPIPPSTNPRGELIFTSRVDKNFRESYERYRDAFERRRNEKALAGASISTWGKLARWITWSNAAAPVRKDCGSEREGGQRTPGSSRYPSRSVTPIDAAAHA